MPKKKIQHKGKVKTSVESSDDFTPNKNTVENVEEEYITVVDYESSQKYKDRKIESNWAKYDASMLDVSESDEQELPKADDFSFLLKNASTDCSHFEFNSEKLWKKEDFVPASEIFNLDLNVLSSGLACVPFHERMGLDESELTEQDKKKFEEEALKSWEVYKPIRENFLKKFKGGSGDNAKSGVDDVVANNEKKTVNTEYLSVERLNLNEKENVGELSSAAVDEIGNESEKKVPSDEKNSNKLLNRTQKTIFSDNDENLEDWLDSVLDD